MNKIRILLAALVVVSGLLTASIVDSVRTRGDLTNQEGRIETLCSALTSQSELFTNQVELYQTEISRLQDERDAYKEQAEYWKGRAAFSGQASGETDRMSFSGFESIEDLDQWLADSPVPDREFTWRVYDCDDFARDLCIEGWIDCKWIGLAGDDHHWFNFTYINNDIIRIEPQTREYEYWGPID
jgi:hypothetical protein